MKNIKNFIGSDLLKILVPYPRLNDGCSWYRINQFVETANRLKLASGGFLKHSFSEQEIDQIVRAADVIIYRFSDRAVNMIRMVRERFPKKAIVLDTDDDLFNLDPLNNAYDSLGTKEVRLPDGTWLWRDGVANFDLWENKKRIIDYEYCLTKSDAVFTTTLRLANKIKPYNEAVIVIPNSIDFELFPDIEIKKPKDRLDLLWAGGSSHFPDLMEIRDGLVALAKKFPNLHFHFAGMDFGAIRKSLPEDRYHFWRWLSPEGHGFRLACIGADVAIAPIKDMEFNYNKSCIKFYEYAAVGIPTVASNIPPYSDEIIDGKTGMLFGSVDEFVEKTSKLLEDSLLRIEIAKNAKNWVKRHRDVKIVIQDWIKALRALVENKK